MRDNSVASKVLAKSRMTLLFLAAHVAAQPVGGSGPSWFDPFCYTRLGSAFSPGIVINSDRGLITPSSTERMVQQQTPNYLITSILVTAGAAIVIKCDFRFYGCA